MTTFADRSGTALLVVDVQNGVVEGAHDAPRVIANIADLVDRARTAGVAVLWVQHESENLPRGSEQWRYVAELPRRDTDPLVAKEYGDSFEGTDLENLLAQRQVGHLVVVGAQSDACIRSTIHGAFTRGYDVSLVSDAHTTEDLTAYGAPTPDKVIAHTNLYWHEQRAPGRVGRTMQTAQVDFRPPDPG